MEPWKISDDELAREEERAAEWFRTASPAERRGLWDVISKTYDDPSVENMSQAAELTFFKLHRQFPDLVIGE